MSALIGGMNAETSKTLIAVVVTNKIYWRKILTRSFGLRCWRHFLFHFENNWCISFSREVDPLLTKLVRPR